MLLEPHSIMQRKVEGLETILNGMDEDGLRALVMRISEDMGSDYILRMSGNTNMIRVNLDPENIKERVSLAVSIDDGEFYNQIGSTFYGYVDPGERACELVEEAIKEEFLDDVKVLMDSGRVEDARALVEAIAEGLRENDSLLSEYAVDFMDEYADSILNAMDDGDPVKGFSWC